MAGRQTGRLTGRQTGRLTGRQTGRLTGRQTGRLKGRQTGRALQNRLASLDPTADAVPPLMVPRVAQVLGRPCPPAALRGLSTDVQFLQKFCKFAAIC